VPSEPLPAGRQVDFIDPATGGSVVQVDGALADPASGRVIARIEHGIPRFVDAQETYASSFGWQWNRWEDALSDQRSGLDAKRKLVLERTRFEELDLDGATILECGMGGGDDTEVLLTLPFSEVHSFDLSNSVDRARRTIDDARLVLSQASIFAIPYPDQAFDVVYCHRVIQHTPDPERALRCVARKVKPGGILFVHSYNRSWRCMSNFKYRYRWITRRMRPEQLASIIERRGPRLHRINQWARRRGRIVAFLASTVVPFEPILEYGDASPEQVLEIGKLVTFDALSPRFDNPMRASTFRRAITEEGFEILHLNDRSDAPLWCTARRSTATVT
jgi:ubiquinone/menaquinone biosynthesis C-methylase UbiE